MGRIQRNAKTKSRISEAIKFYPRGIVLFEDYFLDYENHIPKKLKIIPPETVIKEYERDYSEMTKFMIYGEAPSFSDLLKRLAELQTRVNKLT